MRCGKLRLKDHPIAIQSAVVGMNLDQYVKNRVALKLYGAHFWYAELTRATQVIAVYEGKKFLGVLLANFRGEPKVINSVLARLYVQVGHLLGNILQPGADPYDVANASMLTDYSRTYVPDGEIGFLAADPRTGTKGVGTALLKELEKREPGKEIYLYTDSNCTYRF